MTERVLAGLAGSPLPEFGASAPRRDTACSPRELFQCLALDPEENVPFFECAFELAASNLAATPAVELDHSAVVAGLRLSPVQDELHVVLDRHAPSLRAPAKL